LSSQQLKHVPEHIIPHPPYPARKGVRNLKMKSQGKQRMAVLDQRPVWLTMLPLATGAQGKVVLGPYCPLATSEAFNFNSPGRILFPCNFLAAF